MTQDEIIAGNKVIAEFMGYTFIGDHFYHKDKGRGTWFKHAKYHCSWDWLMPVCKKLDCLAEDKTIPFSKDYEFHCDLLDDTVTREYSIAPVWKEVIDFIDWFNKTK